QELAEALSRPKGRRGGVRTLHGLPAVGARTEVKCRPVIAALGGGGAQHGRGGRGEGPTGGAGGGGATPAGRREAGGAGGTRARCAHGSQVPACDRGPGRRGNRPWPGGKGPRSN